MQELTLYQIGTSLLVTPCPSLACWQATARAFCEPMFTVMVDDGISQHNMFQISFLIQPPIVWSCESMTFLTSCWFVVVILMFSSKWPISKLAQAIISFSCESFKYTVRFMNRVIVLFWLPNAVMGICVKKQVHIWQYLGKASRVSWKKVNPIPISFETGKSAYLLSWYAFHPGITYMYMIHTCVSQIVYTCTCVCSNVTLYTRSLPVADVDVELTPESDQIKRTEKNCMAGGTSYTWWMRVSMYTCIYCKQTNAETQYYIIMHACILGCVQ